MRAMLSKRIENAATSAIGATLLLCLCACAGMNHEPQSPAETPSEAPAAAPRPAPEPEAAMDAPELQEAEEEPSDEPASREDLEQALQVVIQDDALLNELKLGEPGRFPLKISGNSVASGMQLQAHTEAVEVVGDVANPKEEPVLVFTDIDLNAKQGRFKYRYDIEGVRGTSYVFKNEAGVWELKSSRVSGY